MRSSNVKVLAIVLSAVLVAALVPAAFAENTIPVWLTEKDVPAGFAGQAVTPAQAGYIALPSLGAEGTYVYANAAGEMVMGWTIVPRNPLVQSILLGAMPSGTVDSALFQAIGGAMYSDMIADALAQAGVPGGPVKGTVPGPVAGWQAVGERSGALAVDVRVGEVVMSSEMALVQRGAMIGGILYLYPKDAKPATGIAELAQKLDGHFQEALAAGEYGAPEADGEADLAAVDGATLDGFVAQKSDTFTVYTPKDWASVPVSLKSLGVDSFLQMQPADLVSMIFATLSATGTPVTPEMLAAQGLDAATVEQSVAMGIEMAKMFDAQAPAYAKLWTSTPTGLPQMVVGQYAAQSYGAPGDFVQLISDAVATAGVAPASQKTNMMIAGRPAANVVLDGTALGLPMQASVYFIQDQEGGYIWTVAVFLTDNIGRDAGTFDQVMQTLTIP